MSLASAIATLHSSPWRSVGWVAPVLTGSGVRVLSNRVYFLAVSVMEEPQCSGGSDLDTGSTPRRSDCVVCFCLSECMRKYGRPEDKNPEFATCVQSKFPLLSHPKHILGSRGSTVVGIKLLNEKLSGRSTSTSCMLSFLFEKVHLVFNEQ